MSDTQDDLQDAIERIVIDGIVDELSSKVIAYAIAELCRAHFQRRAEPVADVIVSNNGSIGREIAPRKWATYQRELDKLKDNSWVKAGRASIRPLYLDPPIPPDPKPVRFDLDENAAENLRDFIGDEEAMAVTLSVGHIEDEETGVVEYGLRATAADYPEEGSIMLVPMPLPAAPTPPDMVMVPRDLMNELECGSSNFDRYGVTQRYCPICGEQREDGHAADCDLAKAMIAAANKEGA